jgi:hypothetical protein
MATIRIVVTVPPSKAAALAIELRAKGMKIASVMEAIGVITGEVAARDLPALEALPGVTVEREGSVQLNPPDAPVQ